MFGKFRKNSLKNYELCLSHYLSAPDLSWDAMLNMNRVELELISNENEFLIFVRDIANNKGI